MAEINDRFTTHWTGALDPRVIAYAEKHGISWVFVEVDGGLMDVSETVTALQPGGTNAQRIEPTMQKTVRSTFLTWSSTQATVSAEELGQLQPQEKNYEFLLPIEPVTQRFWAACSGPDNQTRRSRETERSKNNETALERQLMGMKIGIPRVKQMLLCVDGLEKLALDEMKNGWD
ncbi:hypothetical protein IFR05_006688 [Cadophora sp. M221]|nr:hypothetical protein IFR05_006688 [Cadophora sp. M221]